MDLNFEQEQNIQEIQEELADKFPIEANYGSRCSLWSEGLNADIVSKDEYNLARTYYGHLWNYVGD